LSSEELIYEYGIFKNQILWKGYKFCFETQGYYKVYDRGINIGWKKAELVKKEVLKQGSDRLQQKLYQSTIKNNTSKNHQNLDAENIFCYKIDENLYKKDIEELFVNDMKIHNIIDTKKGIVKVINLD